MRFYLRGAMSRRSPFRSPALTRGRSFLHRLDRVAGDLNVLLVALAIGLATLDFTFLVTEKVIEKLPPVTVVTYEAPNSQH